MSGRCSSNACFSLLHPDSGPSLLEHPLCLLLHLEKICLTPFPLPATASFSLLSLTVNRGISFCLLPPSSCFLLNPLWWSPCTPGLHEACSHLATSGLSRCTFPLYLHPFLGLRVHSARQFLLFSEITLLGPPSSLLTPLPSPLPVRVPSCGPDIVVPKAQASVCVSAYFL